MNTILEHSPAGWPLAPRTLRHGTRVVLASSEGDPEVTERAPESSEHAVERAAARAAREQLHFEADLARRTAINARVTAERARLATYTRVRHRP